MSDDRLGYIDVATAAQRLGVDRRYMARLCKAGRVNGAVRESELLGFKPGTLRGPDAWMIPEPLRVQRGKRGRVSKRWTPTFVEKE